MVCYGTIGRHHGPPSGLTWFFGIAFEFLLFVGPCSIGKLEHCYTKITLNFIKSCHEIAVEIIPSELYEYDSHHHLCLKYNFRLKACQLEQLKNESYNADYSTNVPKIFARTFGFRAKIISFRNSPKADFRGLLTEILWTVKVGSSKDIPNIPDLLINQFNTYTLAPFYNVFSVLQHPISPHQRKN